MRGENGNLTIHQHQTSYGISGFKLIRKVEREAKREVSCMSLSPSLTFLQKFCLDTLCNWLFLCFDAIQITDIGIF